MIGRKRRAQQVNEAIRGYAGTPDKNESDDEVFRVRSGFYTEKGSVGNLVTYAQYDKSYTSADEDFEQPVDAWRRAMGADMGQWVENNAPGSQKDMLLAIEMPESDDGTLSGGAFVRWDTDGSMELYRYLLQKGVRDPETGAQELAVTDLERLAVDDTTPFPAPQQSQITMSMRGRAQEYDGKQVAETPARQSYERSFTTALRDAVDQYKVDNDSQLPKGTTRYSRELSTGGRTLLLKRYVTPGEELKTLEAVTSRTVKQGGEWSGYKEAVEEMEFADHAVQFRTPDSPRWGEYMTVYPPQEDGSTTADMVRLRNGLHRFTFHIAPDGDTIVTAGKKVPYDPESGDGIGRLPEGTRVIASARGLMAKGEAYDDAELSDSDRTPDERLLMAARQALADKKTKHAA